MNFTFIPYFLTVVINDFVNTSWSLGPDYIFKVKKTTSVYRKPFTIVEWNCKLQCQPKILDSLVCSMPNVSFQTMITYENSTKNILPLEMIEIPHLFEMKFNKSGVQSLLMRPSDYLNAVGIIRQIAEVFNVSIDLYSRKIMYGAPRLQESLYLIDDFSSWEQTLRGNCNTYNRIMYDDDFEENDKKIQRSKRSNFHLTMQPLVDYFAEYNIKTPIFIEKTRQECSYSERYMELLNDMKVTNYFNTMKIADTQFKNSIEIVANITPNLWNSKESRVFSERVELSLIKVKRARKTLPDISKNEWITLDTQL